MPSSSGDTSNAPVPESPSENGTALSEETSGTSAVTDNTNQTENPFIDQLSILITKLSLDLAKESDSEVVAAELEDKQNGSGDSFPGGQTSGLVTNGRPLTDTEVIVNNQSANSTQVNKELQAILQWMVASQFNVPNLTFLNESNKELSKLPLLAEKAGKKAYRVGDILQAVRRYFVQQQMDTVAGNVPPRGLLDWLLANM